jgi:hypothetical protein
MFEISRPEIPACAGMTAWDSHPVKIMPYSAVTIFPERVSIFRR